MSCRSGTFICSRIRTFTLTLIQLYPLISMTNIQSHQMWHQPCKYFKPLLVGALLLLLFYSRVKNQENEMISKCHRGHFSVEIKLNDNSSLTTVSEQQAPQRNKPTNFSSWGCVCEWCWAAPGWHFRMCSDVVLSNCKRSWPYFWNINYLIFILLPMKGQLCTHRSFCELGRHTLYGLSKQLNHIWAQQHQILMVFPPKA